MCGETGSGLKGRNLLKTTSTALLVLLVLLEKAEGKNVTGIKVKHAVGQNTRTSSKANNNQYPKNNYKQSTLELKKSCWKCSHEHSGSAACAVENKQLHYWVCIGLQGYDPLYRVWHLWYSLSSCVAITVWSNISTFFNKLCKVHMQVFLFSIVKAHNQQLP